MRYLYEMRTNLMILLYGGICWLVMLVLMIAFSGCYSERKAQRQVDKAHNLHPLVLAKKCADNYPCKDSVHVLTEYIQGEDVVFTDTLVEMRTDLDTVTFIKYITKTVKQTDTVRDTKYIQQTDKAAIKVCEGDKATLQKANIELTDSRDDWKTWCVTGWCIIGLFFVIWLIRLYVKRVKKPAQMLGI